MSGPADVERIIAAVVSSLESSSRDVTIGGVHPGQVTVPRSHEDLRREREREKVCVSVFLC